MRNLLLLVVFLFVNFAQAQYWDEHLVDESGYAHGGTGVDIADIDGDGDTDIINSTVSYDIGRILWHENLDGNATSWERHILSGTATKDLMIADIDGDGDFDVLAAEVYESRTVWWENTAGDASSWTRHVIGGDYFSFRHANSVFAADFNNDGFLDVVGSARISDVVKVWLSVDGSGLVWTEHTVDTVIGTPRDVEAADLDGDGDQDILGAASDAQEIAWWENDGNGDTWIKHVVESGVSGAYGVATADIDNDGDLDVVGAASAQGLTWWENVDGAGMNWDAYSIHSYFPGLIIVRATDIDSDGNIDIIGAGQHTVNWYRNLEGNGRSWYKQMVARELNLVTSVIAEDLDGDAIKDMIAVTEIYYENGEVYWWKQTPIPIAITLSPTSPTNLPAGGGTLSFDVNVTSNLNATVYQLDFWTQICLPNGAFYPQVQFLTAFIHTPFFTFTGSLSQNIPAMAPSGQYEMWGMIGYDPGHHVTTGGYFTFTKSPGIIEGYGTDNWESVALQGFEEKSDLIRIPDLFDLVSISPNPFNSNTTISVSLPQSAELSVIVYNVTGQQVAELASDQFSTGNHILTFDASGLASGIYFVHAAMQGEQGVIQKVVLVR